MWAQAYSETTLMISAENPRLLFCIILLLLVFQFIGLNCLGGPKQVKTRLEQLVNAYDVLV